MATTREVLELLRARPASDGDGVRLMRVFGGEAPERFDPFLMMDEFGSDTASDYIGGFPSHPHRGFETITYMLEGHMEHQDHLGNVGTLHNGDVQWMTAGAGIIHSEMPQQTEGRMRGFQVWLNLPARDKMQPPSWQDIAAIDIPQYEVDGIKIRALAGELSLGEQRLTGAVTGLTTQPGYLDLAFPSHPVEQWLQVPDGHRALLYVYEGELRIGDEQTLVGTSQLARLSEQGAIRLSSSGEARAILLTGQPLNEPIVQYGPFVMNRPEEIRQALADYQQGTLAAARRPDGP